MAGATTTPELRPKSEAPSAAAAALERREIPDTVAFQETETAAGPSSDPFFTVHHDTTYTGRRCNVRIDPEPFVLLRARQVSFGDRRDEIGSIVYRVVSADPGQTYPDATDHSNSIDGRVGFISAQQRMVHWHYWGHEARDLVPLAEILDYSRRQGRTLTFDIQDHFTLQLSESGAALRSETWSEILSGYMLSRDIFMSDSFAREHLDLTSAATKVNYEYGGVVFRDDREVAVALARLVPDAAGRLALEKLTDQLRFGLRSDETTDLVIPRAIGALLQGGDIVRATKGSQYDDCFVFDLFQSTLRGRMRADETLSAIAAVAGRERRIEGISVSLTFPRDVERSRLLLIDDLTGGEAPLAGALLRLLTETERSDSSSARKVPIRLEGFPQLALEVGFRHPERVRQLGAFCVGQSEDANGAIVAIPWPHNVLQRVRELKLEFHVNLQEQRKCVLGDIEHQRECSAVLHNLAGRIAERFAVPAREFYS